MLKLYNPKKSLKVRHWLSQFFLFGAAFYHSILGRYMYASQTKPICALSIFVIGCVYRRACEIFGVNK